MEQPLEEVIVDDGGKLKEVVISQSFYE